MLCLSLIDDQKSVWLSDDDSEAKDELELYHNLPWIHPEFTINKSPHSEMSRQSSERQTEASTPFPQDVANQVNVDVTVMTIDDVGDVDNNNCKYFVSSMTNSSSE